ncbi:MAG: MATE family efflux transporter [Hungatella sp.]|nr:MATE family efflux transporter [Hungatella sp.]
MMFTRRKLVDLMVPLIIEQLFLGTIGIVDMLMVAPVGETAISGISLVNSINMLFHSIFSALAVGGGILCTQYLGRGEEDHGNQAGRQLFFMAGGFSVLAAAVCCLANPLVLSGLFPTAGPDVLSEGVTYFYLAALSYPCVMIFDACGALFRGMGSTRIPLLGSVVMSVGNVILNGIFIYGLRWGVFGAGFASLCAKAAGVCCLLAVLAGGNHAVSIRKWKSLPKDRVMRRNILRLAVPMAMEDGVFHVGKLLVQGVVASFGTSAIAANAVALTIADFTQMPAYAIGLGLTTVVGQCIGAGEKEQAQMYARKILMASFLIAAGLSALTWGAAGEITRLYRLTEETAVTAGRLIRFHALICGLTWILAFNVPCVLRAASDVTFILYVSVFSMWVFRVGCSYLFREILDVGVLGVWMAMGLDWTFRAAVFTGRLRSGKWLGKAFI